MKFFIDLIARSYLEYAQEKDDNIAQFYFQEYYKVRPEANAKEVYSKKQFYNKLILKLDSLIKDSIPKPIDIDLDTSNQEISNQIGTIQYEEEMAYEEAREDAEHQMFLIQEGLPIPKDFNWEKCMDADKLIEQIKKRRFTLKDPITIINPNIDIYPNPLVLRKSKLEYLKEEAIRSSNANHINDLDIPQTPNNAYSKSKIIDPSFNIKKAVRKAFQFTLNEDPRKHRQILSEEDNIKLIEWVTYYFVNNFELPDIEIPISTVNTSQENIVWTFKLIYYKLQPGGHIKDSLYNLIKLCFYKFRDDNIENYKKRSRPYSYDDFE